MPYAIIAKLRDDSAEARSQLRLKHLTYIDDHKASIVAGGPTLKAGRPHAMIIFTEFTSEADTESFIRREPYAASGRVFDTIDVLEWSQVLPEKSDGQLAQAILDESAKSSEGA